ncbi:unnamed protein product [Amoebophrya sp. A25]|nr:unnamed protein product [Amoebophrya sp. A25]|eukprot:GSA25T00015579001.1
MNSRRGNISVFFTKHSRRARNIMPFFMRLLCSLATVLFMPTSAASSSDVATSNATNCDFGQSTSHLRSGARATICVFIDTASGVKKMVYSVKVDEHASLTLTGSQGLTDSAIQGENSRVYAWAAAAGEGSAHPISCSGNDLRRNRVTCPQIYRQGSKIVPFVSLVINVSEGAVKSLVWDNLCPNCSDDACLRSQTALDEKYEPTGEARDVSKTCSQDTSGLEQAHDFKIFLTWAGTDVNGRHCKSSAFRFSRFAGSTLSDMYRFTTDSYHSAWGDD